MRSHRTLAIALPVFCGCRSGGSEAGRSQPGVAADTVAARAEGRLDTTETGVEFEALRLIPGMLARVGAVADSAGRIGEGMATGYKQAAGRLVDAMLRDLNRVGVGDTGGFRGMGDQDRMSSGRS